MNVKRILATGGLIAAASFAAATAMPGAALADTATTPVGQLTSGQVGCNDFGAVVSVSVIGGLPNARYEASVPQGGLSWSDGFVSNASGAGTVQVYNVLSDAGAYTGVATVTLTANGQAGQVTVSVSCTSGKGD